MKEIKDYCTNCKLLVEVLPGFYYWKCSRCYKAVKLSFFNRHRAGKIEIQEKERKIKEELKKRQENEKKEEVSKEEHEERIKMLKNLGLLKEGSKDG